MGLKSIKVANLSSSSLEEEFVFFLVETPDTQEKTLLRLSSRAATVTARLRHSDRTVAAW
jgi:hypothetical protein